MFDEDQLQSLSTMLVGTSYCKFQMYSVLSPVELIFFYYRCMKLRLGRSRAVCNIYKVRYVVSACRRSTYVKFTSKGY
jgi:hypothetical protein